MQTCGHLVSDEKVLGTRLEVRQKLGDLWYLAFGFGDLVARVFDVQRHPVLLQPKVPSELSKHLERTVCLLLHNLVSRRSYLSGSLIGIGIRNCIRFPSRIFSSPKSQIAPKVVAWLCLRGLQLELELELERHASETAIKMPSSARRDRAHVER